MMSVKKFITIIMALVIASLACQAATGAVDTPTPDLGPAQTITAQAQELANQQAELSAAQTAEALASQQTEIAQGEQAQATEEASSLATAAMETETALNAAASETAEAASILEATAEIERQATAWAEPMLEQLEMLQEDGVLLSTDGEYIPLADFDESWAQLNWYRWWRTDFEPERYAVYAETSWSSASDKANWFSSGCGFVIGEQDEDNHHVIYLGLDGYVYLSRVNKGDYRNIAKEYYGKVSVPDGDANVLLVVLDDKVHYYVNGTKVLQATDNLLEQGGLGLTLLSGTNKDYGTRCEMTDIGLWIFE
jgi:hypothetical protein